MFSVFTNPVASRSEYMINVASYFAESDHVVPKATSKLIVRINVTRNSRSFRLLISVK